MQDRMERSKWRRSWNDSTTSRLQTRLPRFRRLRKTQAGRLAPPRHTRRPNPEPKPCCSIPTSKILPSSRAIRAAFSTCLARSMSNASMCRIVIPKWKAAL